MKVPQTNAWKNQSFANWVHYIMKNNARGILPDIRVEALDGLDFQWTTGQPPPPKPSLRSGLPNSGTLNEPMVLLHFLKRTRKSTPRSLPGSFMPKAWPSRC
jgi:hypothetical protein